MKKYTRIANILSCIGLVGFAAAEIYWIPRDINVAAAGALSFLLACIGGWLMGYYWEKSRRG